ncbi:hypothetical protein BDR04DRAFT_1095455 [Suillus decipiens]|nr:hypothetical protein BDR04DRAFT_1095455 [Suillus decipiens]
MRVNSFRICIVAHSSIYVRGSASNATAHDRGYTAHHMFAIPVTDGNVNLIHLYSPPRADLIRNITAIIWDEYSGSISEIIDTD